MKRAFKIWCSRRIVRFKNLVKLARDRKHDRFPPNGGLVREIPLFQGNLGWWNIIPFGQENGLQLFQTSRRHWCGSFFDGNFLYTGLSAPTSNQWNLNMKVYRDPLLKIYNNPGGDCYWAGGQTDLYNAYMIFVAILRLNSKYKLRRCWYILGLQPKYPCCYCCVIVCRHFIDMILAIFRYVKLLTLHVIISYFRLFQYMLYIITLQGTIPSWEREDQFRTRFGCGKGTFSCSNRSLQNKRWIWIEGVPRFESQTTKPNTIYYYIVDMTTTPSSFMEGGLKTVNYNNLNSTPPHACINHGLWRGGGKNSEDWGGR